MLETYCINITFFTSSCDSKKFRTNDIVRELGMQIIIVDIFTVTLSDTSHIK